MLIIICLLLIFMFGISSLSGGSEESLYYIKNIFDPEVLGYVSPGYCTFNTHPTLKIPDYEASDFEVYYWTLRRGLVRFILPVIPVLSDFLSAYWFIKKNNYKEIILLDPYAGIISEILVKFFKIKIHYFTNKKAKDSYGRFPNKEDFKKLKGLPIINLSFFLYKIYTPENLFNGSMFTNVYAKYLIDNFKPVKAMSKMVSYKADVSFKMYKGDIMMFPYRSCTSNQKFFHYYNGGKEIEDLKLISIFGNLCIFDFCTRNLNHSATLYENWDLNMFFKIAGDDWKKIEAIFGKLPRRRYNDPRGLDFPEPRDENRFLNKVPGDLDLQNSYVSGFCEDFKIPFKRYVLDDYDFIWRKVEMNNCSVIVVNEMGYKTLRRSLAGFDLKKNSFLILTYTDFLFNIVMYFGKVYCLEETTEYIKKHINNTNYYSFNKYNREQVDIDFINWKPNKWTRKAVSDGAAIVKKLVAKMPVPKRIWIEYNQTREFMIELLHEVFPDTILLAVGWTLTYYYVINMQNKEGVIKPEEGDWIWKV